MNVAFKLWKLKFYIFIYIKIFMPILSCNINQKVKDK